jgi:hypothetical protein
MLIVLLGIAISGCTLVREPAQRPSLIEWPTAALVAAAQRPEVVAAVVWTETVIRNAKGRTMSQPQPLLLTEATAQEIQLELMHRWQYNAFDGERVTASQLKHRALWRAVIMDRFCFSKPGKLPSIGLLKLRDLPDNIWNVDTMYILTAGTENAHRLATIIEAAP